MIEMRMMAAAGVLGALVCGCSTMKVDSNGFVRFDGTMPAEAPSDYFVLRFEYPDGVHSNGWHKGQTRWMFTEVRQLKEGSPTGGSCGSTATAASTCAAVRRSRSGIRTRGAGRAPAASGTTRRSRA